LLEDRLEAGGPRVERLGIGVGTRRRIEFDEVCSDRLETSGPREEEIRDADREKRNDADDRGNRDAEQVQGRRSPGRRRKTATTAATKSDRAIPDS